MGFRLLTTVTQLALSFLRAMNTGWGGGLLLSPVATTNFFLVFMTLATEVLLTFVRCEVKIEIAPVLTTQLKE